MAWQIANKKILFDYHNVLFKLVGVTTDWISADGETFTLCGEEHCNPFCRMIMATPEGLHACRTATAERMALCRSNRRNHIFACHAGLVDTAVPLFLDDCYIGCLSAGQFLTAPPSEEHFSEVRQMTAHLNLDEARLREAYFHTPVFSPEKVDSLLELLGLIGEYVVKAESRLFFFESINDRKPIRAARHYIECNYRKKLTVRRIAAAVGLSESHFGHRFTEVTGKAPVEYLNSYRIEKAVELLNTSDMPIGDIAQEVGFQSLPHFNRIFRQVTGKTPREMRKLRFQRDENRNAQTR